MKTLVIQNKIYKIQMFVFFVSVLIGSILFIILKCSSVNDSTYDLIQFEPSQITCIPSQNMFVHIIEKRIIMLVFVCGMGLFLPYCMSDKIVAFLFGGYYGFVLSDLFYHSVIYGVLYGFFCFFPHYLMYWHGILQFYHLLQQKQMKNENYGVKKIQYFLRSSVIFILFVLGIVWEVFIQKIFLQNFYQYLV